MSKVSKNQRVHPKQTARVRHCAEGHALVNVLVVGRGMTLQCACTGYAPIDTSDKSGYRALQPKQKPPGSGRTGGAHVWFELPSIQAAPR